MLSKPLNALQILESQRERIARGTDTAPPLRILTLYQSPTPIRTLEGSTQSDIGGEFVPAFAIEDGPRALQLGDGAAESQPEVGDVA
jgi:hypothetical protein